MAAFEFGPFLLDPAKRSLLRDGVPQSLTPKAFDLLALLVRHRERVLSKEELISTLWPETFVEEANLSQQIFVIRRTLNGDSEGADYVATIPRRGYRFTAQVIERSDSERLAGSAPNDPSRRRSRWLVPSLGAAVVLVAALLAVFWRQFAADPDPRILVVTAFPGLERFPSISPDGNFVVFSWTGSNPDGRSDLWVKAVDDDALRRLTETPAAEVHPAWSPDGREIAFIRVGQGAFIVSALGGQERRISGSASMVGWTPDSKSLLVRDRTDEGPHGIFRIELATGTQGGLQPRQGPDGRTLYYLDRLPAGAFGVSGTSRLMQVPVAGGQEAVVLDRVRFGLWSVTQDGIVFLTVGADADAIDFYGFGDRVVRRLGTLPFRVSRIAGLGGLTASWDGRWVLVSTTDVWESDIMVVDGVR